MSPYDLKHAAYMKVIKVDEVMEKKIEASEIIDKDKLPEVLKKGDWV